MSERKLIGLTLVEPVVIEVSVDSVRSGNACRHVVRLVRFRTNIDPAEIRRD